MTEISLEDGAVREREKSKRLVRRNKDSLFVVLYLVVFVVLPTFLCIYLSLHDHLLLRFFFFTQLYLSFKMVS